MKQIVMVVGCLMAGAALANVKPANIFTDNMVLQRDKVVPVWGTADAGEEVRVSFAGQTVSAKADADGAWEVKLQPLSASKENRVMTLEGKNKVTLKDILVGDVWLCSGQSNMEMNFAWGVYDGDAFMKEAAEKYDQIRCIKVSKIRASWPRSDVKLDHPWARTAKDGIRNWTATGYFFARKLVQELDVPVGILDDNWSGCAIEPFTSLEAIKAYQPKTQANKKYIEGFVPQAEKADPRTPSGKAAFAKYAADMKVFLAKAEEAVAAGQLPEADMPSLPSLGGATSQYNAMIAPIVHFPVRGAIWYQGCSNGQEGETYTEKTEMLVNGWRKAWGYDFPFYWVQLASFTAKTEDPKGGNGYALIRDAQRLALKRLDKTGMAVAIDVGNDKDIHPKAKVFVGERLAAWALKGEYGKDVIASGPLFKEAKGLGTAEVTLAFDYADGLTAGEKDNLSNAPVKLLPDAKLVGFAAELEDGKFVWADAKIAGDTVVVTAAGKKIRNVRYGYRANATGLANLYNKAALPASPFATENKW